MRQLHLMASTDPKSGGPVEVLLTTARVMHERGHTIEVASLDDPNAPWLATFPLKIHPLGPGTRPFAFSRRFVPWLRRKATDYDVAIVHGLWNFSSAGGWLGLGKSRLPYLVFAHGMLDPWFRKAYPLKHVFKQIYWSALEGRVLRDAEGVLFTADDELALARTSFRGHAYNGVTIRLGTADAPSNVENQVRSFYSSCPHLDGRPFLLFLSRIHPKKGCDLLIDAFSRIAGSTNFELVIAGPDQIGWRSSLEERARRLGISHRVHWAGMLTGDIKWGALRAARALVLPSHQENFGVVVAEAMACSLPVLITNKVNIWREVQRCGGGLVSDDTDEGIFNLLHEFSALDGETLQAMRNSARNGFLKYFDIQSTTNDFEAACAAAASLQLRVATR